MGFEPRPGLDAVVVKQRTFSGQDPRGRRGDPGGSSGIVAGGQCCASAAGFDARVSIPGVGEQVEAADADDTTAGPQAADAENLPREGTPHAVVPAKARRVHPRLYNDAEETELGAAQG